MRINAAECVTGPLLTETPGDTESGALSQVVDITQEQMAALCGNVLELEDGRGLPVLAMSTRVRALWNLLLPAGCCSA